MKRIVAIFLSIALCFSYAGSVFASEDENPSAEMAVRLAEQPEEEPIERPEEQEQSTEAADVLSASLDGTFVSGEGYMAFPYDLSNEELYDEYIYRLFYPDGDQDEQSPYMDGLGEDILSRLSVLDRRVFLLLKRAFTEVASGERTSTQFSFTAAELGVSDQAWTAADLGISSMTEDGRLSDEATDAMRELIDFDLILEALLRDSPYEEYWFANSYGWTLNLRPSYDPEANEFLLHIESLTARFAIKQHLFGGGSAEDFELDSTSVDAAKAAAANAKAIVEKYKNVGDYEKLCGYCKEICDRVTYDTSAAMFSSMAWSGRDPWKLVYVFDDNSSTNVVCEGYSKAFQYLCDLTDFTGDIRCITVTGDMDDGPHMWNIVTIGAGNNYLADVTNSDVAGVAPTSLLFLVGVESGNPQDGYLVRLGEDTINYVYDDIMHELYGEGYLTLSEEAYDPATPIPPAVVMPNPPELPSVSPGETETEVLTYGFVGDNILWVLTDDGVLTISGAGDMQSISTGSTWRDVRYRNSIKKVVVEEGITGLGDNAFYYCTVLEEVTLPEGIQYIGESAFSDCAKLEEVVIPESVTSIEGWAFSNCAGLTEITIPKNVASIGSSAFYGCTGLERVTVKGDLDDFNSSPFSRCSSLKEAVFTGESKGVPAGMFRSVSSLESVVISEGVESIGEYAFYSTGIQEIVIPASCTVVGSRAFSNCKSLAKVTIEGELDDFSYSSPFSSCSNLTEAIFMDGVARIPAYMFSFLSSLESVTLSNSIECIGESAFDSTGLKEITIPESVESIDERAFDACSKLTDVYYTGSAFDWERVSIARYNTPLLNAELHIEREQPSLDRDRDGRVTAQDAQAFLAADGGYYAAVVLQRAVGINV